MFFPYDNQAIEYLSAKDKHLGQAIAMIGHIDRVVDTDLFSSVVHHILGQLISTSAQATLWQRLLDAVGNINADSITELGRDRLQQVGITYKKADCILAFAQKVQSGEFSIDTLYELSDDEVIQRLSSLNGIGVWTAEMILIFCMLRPDVVSFGDLAILRGMRMFYRHRVIDRAKFKRYQKRYSPYGTVASLYLWAIAGGAIPGLTDPATRKVPVSKQASAPVKSFV